eukprot:TRINITY_DN3763_c0_g2_i1.p1 TRINITY_DN3763_c0_g2~~TRINITY_DN3763_c0_g2_i1.p1  ORF type:complete len:430 (+),score=131.94 TRINITY_DN3763_c0_g2_i1:62-1351(+)
MVGCPHGDSWAVLIVGGTPGEAYGIDKRPWPDLGQQVSFLQTLGEVYSTLSRTMGKDRIIVIAGVRGVLNWLDASAELGHPPCEPQHLEFCLKHTRVEDPARLEQQKKLYKERAATIRESCKELIEAGGPDYDYERISPDTIVHVLSGDPIMEGDRVVPKEGVGSMFVWFTTHGGHHSVAVGDTKWVEGDPVHPVSSDGRRPVVIDTKGRVCDVCKAPHEVGQEYDHEHSSLRTREWFMLMPQRARDASTYGPVTHAGRDMDLPSSVPTSSMGKISPLTCLYWQQVVSAIAPGCIQGRRVVLLYQFCTSGGHCKWLEDEKYDSHYDVQRWPVFQMATSREQQYSLGGTFTSIYMNVLKAKLLEGGTLQDAYDEAEKEYWEQHGVEAEMNANAKSPSLRFGELMKVEGSKSNVGKTPLNEIFVNECSAKI